ncbi:MAG TPA: hypothetical protein VKE93_14240, partial [Candidatus Angelobacter sp.]|nr:hypothetical protein [Candidatus Angelobacter sp.]
KAALGRQKLRRQRSGWQSAAVCWTRKLTATKTEVLLIEHVSSAIRKEMHYWPRIPIRLNTGSARAQMLGFARFAA